MKLCHLQLLVSGPEGLGRTVGLPALGRNRIKQRSKTSGYLMQLHDDPKPGLIFKPHQIKLSDTASNIDKTLRNNVSDMNKLWYELAYLYVSRKFRLEITPLLILSL